MDIIEHELEAAIQDATERGDNDATNELSMDLETYRHYYKAS